MAVFGLIAVKVEMYSIVKVICIINFPIFTIMGISSLINPELVIELTTKKILTANNILYQKIKGIIFFIIGILFLGRIFK